LAGREAGADQIEWAAYLTKPIKQSQLFNLLAGILSEASPAQPVAQPAGVDTSLAERAPLQILLAEDNAFNQKLAVHILGQMGYRPDLAANGVETLDAVERRELAGESYDVILMDVQMPEMDGFAATRAIREKEALTGEHIPVIAMTAYAMRGDKERCLEAGMDGYLAKPLKMQEFQDVLSHYNAKTVQTDPIVVDRQPLAT
jgi:CheY-like chemotaxis protein